jgi:hypothetical protein
MDSWETWHPVSPFTSRANDASRHKWGDAATLILVFPWVEANLNPFEINLVPAQAAKSTKTVSEVIGNHEEWPQVIGKLIPQP